jgi:glycosyltransferase involved in cell wall biosynthesis
MNILHIMGMHYSVYASGAMFYVELAKNAFQRNDNIFFLYEGLEDGHSDFEQFNSDIEKYNGKIILLSSKNKWNFCYELIRIMMKTKIDVVHANFTKARFYTIPIAWMCGIKKLYFTFHSHIPKCNKMKTHTRIWYKWATKVCTIITVSKALELQTRNNWENANIITRYLGVSDSIGKEKKQLRSSLGIKQNSIILTTISNFNYIKGLDVLCYAINLLKKRDCLHHVQFYVIGQYKNDVNELKRLIDELDISEFIILLGRKNFSVVSDYLIASDIYMQSSRAEALGLSICEAITRGLPCIGTNVDGIPEVIIDGYNGILVPSENHLALANAIEKLIKNKNLINEYGQNSKKLSENFRVNVCAQKMYDLYL